MNDTGVWPEFQGWIHKVGQANGERLSQRNPTSFWLDQHDQGEVDSFVSHDHLDVDNVYFPRLVVSFLSSIHKNCLLLRKNHINQSEEGWPIATQRGEELMLQVLYWKLFEVIKFPLFLSPSKHIINNLSAVKEAKFCLQSDSGHLQDELH